MVLDFEDDLLTTISGDLAPIAEAAEQSTETDAQASLSDEDESNTDEPSEEASGE